MREPLSEKKNENFLLFLPLLPLFLHVCIHWCRLFYCRFRVCIIYLTLDSESLSTYRAAKKQHITWLCTKPDLDFFTLYIIYLVRASYIARILQKNADAEDLSMFCTDRIKIWMPYCLFLRFKVSTDCCGNNVKILIRARHCRKERWAGFSIP